MTEAIYFNVNDYVAFENTMIKDKVRFEIIRVDKDSFLPSLEAETIAHFLQEILYMVYDSLLQIRFSPCLLTLKAQEFKRNRLVKDIHRSQCDRLLLYHRG